MPLHEVFRKTLILEGLPRHLTSSLPPRKPQNKSTRSGSFPRSFLRPRRCPGGGKWHRGAQLQRLRPSARRRQRQGLAMPKLLHAEACALSTLEVGRGLLVCRLRWWQLSLCWWQSVRPPQGQCLRPIARLRQSPSLDACWRKPAATRPFVWGAPSPT